MQQPQADREPAGLAWNEAFESHLPIGRLPDGTWLYAPVGELRMVDGGQRVVCHACGEPLSSLSVGHLSRHALTPETYRERFGLNRKASLLAPVAAEVRRVEGVRRWAENAGVRKGLGQGQEMARSGVLHELGAAAQPRGGRRAQGRLAASRDGASPALRAVRERQVTRARARWGARVQELGFADLGAYLTARRGDGSSAHRVREELGCGGSVAARLLASR